MDFLFLTLCPHLLVCSLGFLLWFSAIFKYFELYLMYLIMALMLQSFHTIVAKQIAIWLIASCVQVIMRAMHKINRLLLVVYQYIKLLSIYCAISSANKFLNGVFTVYTKIVSYISLRDQSFYINFWTWMKIHVRKSSCLLPDRILFLNVSVIWIFLSKFLI